MRHELLNFVSHSHHGRGPFKESGVVRRKCQNPEKRKEKAQVSKSKATREFCLDADEPATLLNDHGSAVTSTARKGEKEYDFLHLSRPSGPVVKCHQSSQSPENHREARDNSYTLVQQTRVHFGGEAGGHRGGASKARGEPQGCTERRRFPLRAYNQRPPRPVQTGGGRSVTPLSTQLVALGRLLLFG